MKIKNEWLLDLKHKSQEKKKELILPFPPPSNRFRVQSLFSESRQDFKINLTIYFLKYTSARDFHCMRRVDGKDSQKRGWKITLINYLRLEKKHPFPVERWHQILATKPSEYVGGRETDWLVATVHKLKRNNAFEWLNGADTESRGFAACTHHNGSTTAEEEYL